MNESKRVNQEVINWIQGTPLGFEVYSVVSFPPHMHEDVLELLYCLKGECKVTIASDELSFQEGMFLSIDKDAYYFAEGKDCVCASIYIDLTKYRDKYPQLEHILFLCDGINKKNYFGNSDKLKGIIISLINYLVENEELNSDEVTAITDKLLRFIICNFDILFAENDVGQVIDDIAIERYNVINAYIAKHLTGKITVSDVADELGLTPGYVSEFCRRYSIGFRNMVSYRRVNLAEKYLLTTDFTIADIAAECGFSDTKYFYRAFRKWHLHGPKQFRQLYLNKMYVGEKTAILDRDEIKPLVEKTRAEHYNEMFFTALS